MFLGTKKMEEYFLKKIGILVGIIIMSSMILCGCSEQKSNAKTDDFAKIHEESYKIAKAHFLIKDIPTTILKVLPLGIEMY